MAAPDLLPTEAHQEWSIQDDMNQGFVDYYQVLELPAFAPEAEVKAAWRRLAKLHHPDRNPEDPSAAGRFEKIHQAYRVLVDPAQRKLYDEGYSRITRRARPVQQEPSSASSTARPRRPSSSKSDASNSSAKRTQTADPSASSTRRKTTRRAQEPPKPRTGADLHRSIKLPLDRFRGGGSLKVLMDHLERPLILHMPDAVIPGEELILPGKGRPGVHGGPAGRLLLKVEADLPPGVELQGSDLVIQQSIHVIRAMIGGSVVLNHPDGRALELKLQAGAHNGQRLRMRGMGLPGEEEDGDLVIVIQVNNTPIKNARARRLLEKALRLLEKE